MHFAIRSSVLRHIGLLQMNLRHHTLSKPLYPWWGNVADLKGVQRFEVGLAQTIPAQSHEGN
jgi:hypothetical protein